ncbi:MAG: putative colanic acid biosynthesis UDP-glucose lipid carrier transferase, partial [Candidatus Azotimanducaceae bacterium]
FPDEYINLVVIVFLMMQVVYSGFGVYRHEDTRSDYIGALLQAWGVLVISLGVFGFVTRTSEDFSRQVILLWSVTGFLGQLVVFALMRRFAFGAVSEVIPTLVVGSGELAKHIASHMSNNPWIPEQVVGYVTDEDAGLAPWPDGILKLGSLDSLHSVVTEHGVRRVYIAIPMHQSNLVKPFALGLVESSIDVVWAPDIFGVSLVNHSMKEMAGVPLISLSETPLTGGAAIAKEAMDKTFALLALVIFSPVMLAAAIAVKATSKGPLIFKQSRHGWDGRFLDVYKFRSMKVHEEHSGQVTQATENDDRITAVGRFIRRTSIDELPQLFNVLEGTMSLVGPRPHAVEHNEYYRGQIRSYMLRHRVKPGLTGLAQVNGFRGETETIDKMQGRVNYDLAYINNWSIWLDFEILFRTVFIVFGRNAR